MCMVQILKFEYKKGNIKYISDAHDIEFYHNNSLNKKVKCDLLLDDGQHTLQSMVLKIVVPEH